MPPAEDSTPPPDPPATTPPAAPPAPPATPSATAGSAAASHAVGDARRRQARDARRLAMQLLYLIDASPELSDAPDRAALLDQCDPDRDTEAVRETAIDLALAAWRDRPDADRLIAELTPAWPTHRQPPVDRAILRLAYHELSSGRVPVRVAINEAVELAKLFCAETSPPFINGVLDKAAARLGLTAHPRGEDPPAPDMAPGMAPDPAPGTAPTNAAAAGPAESAEAWLRDAMHPQSDDTPGDPHDRDAGQ